MVDHDLLLIINGVGGEGGKQGLPPLPLPLAQLGVQPRAEPLQGLFCLVARKEEECGVVKG